MAFIGCVPGLNTMLVADPLRMPETGESPETLFSRAGRLAGTPGQVYVERRGVPLAIAEAAGVRFDPDFGGRPAVLVAMRDREERLVSVHGRDLYTKRGQNKMLTVGTGGGSVGILGGWYAKPLILVEGLFDALSLAACGWASVATIGRWAPWLPAVSAGSVVWLAFDGNRPGEASAVQYAARLDQAQVHRLAPPSRCKDWNTALLKRGGCCLARWIGDNIAARGGKAS